jgi:flagellar basal-body rod protein FlgC
MSGEAIYAVTRFGLDYERARMEAASRNIALANTPVGQAGKTTAANTGPGFAPQVAQDGSVREVQDPGNPMAGPDGIVRYPATDLATEMTTLMSAQRGYQADIRAFNTLHGMMLKALDIGSR